MAKSLNGHFRGQSGFTLIEVIIVVALLGILSAILIPQVAGLISEGDESRLASDVAAVDLAVAEFANDRHQGPSGGEWGAGPGGKRRWYPTVDGRVGDVEVDLATATTDARGNFRLMKYSDGPGVGAAADATDVADSLVWLGLLVNEPAAVGSAANQTTGGATPQDNEEGEYLAAFPESAHADNSTFESGAASNGSYWYLVLHKGTVAAVYESTETPGTFYIGYDDIYP